MLTLSSVTCFPKGRHCTIGRCEVCIHLLERRSLGWILYLHCSMFGTAVTSLMCSLEELTGSDLESCIALCGRPILKFHWSKHLG